MLYVVEAAFIFVVVTFFITQIIIPLARNMPLFPLFLPVERAAVKAKEELFVAKREKEVSDIQHEVEKVRNQNS